MKEDQKRKIIAIVGPTASGKTSIGARLAKEFNGEIISADSRQVYRGLDLGTGKEGVLGKDGLLYIDDIPQHLIDIKEPMEEFTLFDYLPMARAAIEGIFKRGKIPIIVGGTGLYIQGLVEGFKLVETKNKCIKKHTRDELDNLSVRRLNEVLEKIDPEKSSMVDKKNKHRLIRAIELAEAGLKPIKEKPDFEILQMAIDLPREDLHNRIDKRVEDRFDQGMLKEIIDLLERGVSQDWLIGLGLEYKIITSFILEMQRVFNININELPIKEDDKGFAVWQREYEAMKQELKFKTHQYARRQITWLRRFPEINWLSKYSEIKRFSKIFLEH